MYPLTQTDTPAIVNSYLESTRLSMRSFATQLGVSHAAVSNWVSGKADPETGFLLELLGKHTDWRHNFANDILSRRFPDATFNGHNVQPDPCKEEEQSA